MKVKEIVTEYLKANGYDGLYSEDDECGCKIEDLAPCDTEPPLTCKPGYFMPCECGDGCDFHIGANAVLAKPAPAGELGEAVEMAVDRTIDCRDCKDLSIFTDENQLCRGTGCGEFNKLILARNLLALAVENALLKQGWTAVEKGLPEINEKIEMRWLIENEKTYEDLRRKGYLNERNRWIEDVYCLQHQVREPTHWRPLPDLPEAADE